MAAKKKPGKAPAKRSPRPVVDARVEHIAGMMARGEWETGASHKDLAAKWHISVSAIEKYASQASRVVLRAIGDTEQIRAWGLVTMQVLTRKAEKANEIRTAMHGVSEVMRMSGADAPQKVAITDTSGADVPAFLQRKWAPAVWAWVGAEAAKGHAATEAEMSAYAESLEESASASA